MALDLVVISVFHLHSKIILETLADVSVIQSRSENMKILGD
jgi:hypothetical protein